jgi:hypothetical protein
MSYRRRNGLARTASAHRLAEATGTAWTAVTTLGGMRSRVLALLVVVSVVAGCAHGENYDARHAAQKSRASVEAELLGQARSFADLVGSTVTDWRVETRACDITPPGRLWEMVTRSTLPLPRDRQVAALHAVRDQWDRERWDFGDRRIAPDRLLAEGEPGHLEAGTPFGDASVIGNATQDHLDVIVSSDCYDAVKGEDPGKG